MKGIIKVLFFLTSPIWTNPTPIPLRNARTRYLSMGFWLRASEMFWKRFNENRATGGNLREIWTKRVIHGAQISSLVRKSLSTQYRLIKHPIVVEALNSMGSPTKVLEVGCGSGGVAVALMFGVLDKIITAPLIYTGFDLSRNRIDAARELVPIFKCAEESGFKFETFIAADALEPFTQSENEANVVLLISVLERLTDEEMVLCLDNAAMCSGGIVVIVESADSYPGAIVRSVTDFEAVMSTRGFDLETYDLCVFPEACEVCYQFIIFRKS